ncbi:MAG: GspH/FimT family pseudopilin, partial [Gammaproteobacteria bacterium]|nr:GspH/FimT family pseudopilin [Gammaproteobacteria bacterium]
MKKYAAFSLIELMIILAVVAILVALGVPKITQVTQNNRIIEVTNKISSYLERARSEAINRTSQVGIVATGGGGTNWMVGWDIYLDANSNSQFEAGETILLTVG